MYDNNTSDCIDVELNIYAAFEKQTLRVRVRVCVCIDLSENKVGSSKTNVRGPKTVVTSQLNVFFFY